ncbi:MAG: hypothetical protein AAF593_00795 [Planctomycetota bacterium]
MPNSERTIVQWLSARPQALRSVIFLACIGAICLAFLAGQRTTESQFQAYFADAERVITLGQRIVLVSNLVADPKELDSEEWSLEDREMLEKLLLEQPILRDMTPAPRFEIDESEDQTFTKQVVVYYITARTIDGLDVTTSTSRHFYQPDNDSFMTMKMYSGPFFLGDAAPGMTLDIRGNNREVSDQATAVIVLGETHE